MNSLNKNRYFSPQKKCFRLFSILLLPFFITSYTNISQKSEKGEVGKSYFIFFKNKSYNVISKIQNFRYEESFRKFTTEDTTAFLQRIKKGDSMFLAYNFKEAFNLFSINDPKSEFILKFKTFSDSLLNLYKNNFDFSNDSIALDSMEIEAKRLLREDSLLQAEKLLENIIKINPKHKSIELLGELVKERDLKITSVDSVFLKNYSEIFRKLILIEDFNSAQLIIKSLEDLNYHDTANSLKNKLQNERDKIKKLVDIIENQEDIKIKKNQVNTLLGYSDEMFTKNQLYKALWINEALINIIPKDSIISKKYQKILKTVAEWRLNYKPENIEVTSAITNAILIEFWLKNGKNEILKNYYSFLVGSDSDYFLNNILLSDGKLENLIKLSKNKPNPKDDSARNYEMYISNADLNLSKNNLFYSRAYYLLGALLDSNYTNYCLGQIKYIDKKLMIDYNDEIEKTKKKTIEELVSTAEKLIKDLKLDEARVFINKINSIQPDNAIAKKMLSEIQDENELERLKTGLLLKRIKELKDSALIMEKIDKGKALNIYKEIKLIQPLDVQTNYHIGRLDKELGYADTMQKNASISYDTIEFKRNRYLDKDSIDPKKTPIISLQRTRRGAEISEIAILDKKNENKLPTKKDTTKTVIPNTYKKNITYKSKNILPVDFLFTNSESDDLNSKMGLFQIELDSYDTKPETFENTIKISSNINKAYLDIVKQQLLDFKINTDSSAAKNLVVSKDLLVGTIAERIVNDKFICFLVIKNMSSNICEIAELNAIIIDKNAGAVQKNNELIKINPIIESNSFVLLPFECSIDIKADFSKIIFNVFSKGASDKIKLPIDKNLVPIF